MSRNFRGTEEWLKQRLAKGATATAAPKAPKQRKYRNTPVVDAHGAHDSAKEARRYQELLLRERAGEITELRRQVPYAIIIDGEHVCDYRSDFTYREGARLVIEDTKSVITRKNPLYRLKRALMRSLHKIDITET